jgi:putative hydrolase
VSSPEGFGEGGPFGGGPLGEIMRNLARLFTTQGPLNWEIARQMAQWIATGGEPERNPDPSSRMRLEELIRVAELHVSEATGLQVSASGLLSVRAVTPSDWAVRTLDAWRPLLEKLAIKMTSSLPSSGWGQEDLEALRGPDGEPGADDAMSKLFGNIPQVIGPFMFGLQAGSMIGQLGSRAMGQYDLPMPRPPGDELLMIPATIDKFASDWSLDPDDVRLWVCLRETLNHAVLGRAHVRQRLDELIGSYVDAFEPSTRGLEERLSGFDPTDMGAIQEALGDPETLLGELQNDAQRQIQIPLRAILAAVVGYVDHIMDTVGRRLIGSYGPLTEALRRRRLEESPGTRILGQLFGVALDSVRYEQGESFVRGIVERAGENGLARLWRSARELPTPAELNAPGLWLARIDIDDDPKPNDDPNPSEQPPSS